MSPVTILILLSVFYVLAGACNAGFNKYIVSQIAIGRKFSHSWFLNLIMFIGESMGIPVFYILFNKKGKTEKSENTENTDTENIENTEKSENLETAEPEQNKVREEEKPEINKFLLAIPGFFRYMFYRLSKYRINFITCKYISNA